MAILRYALATIDSGVVFVGGKWLYFSDFKEMLKLYCKYGLPVRVAWTDEAREAYENREEA